MASEGMKKYLGLVLGLIMLCYGAQAQSGCTTAILSLSPCLNYVTGNVTTPSQSCCSQLGSVVQSTPQCLCSLMNGAGLSMGFTINQTLALRLPGACNVVTPPVSQCNAVANGPASSQAPAATPAISPSSPADGTDESPSSTTTQSPTVPSGTGSKTVPSTNGNSSAGNLQNPVDLSTLILFMAAFASILISF